MQVRQGRRIIGGNGRQPFQKLSLGVLSQSTASQAVYRCAGGLKAENG